MISKEIIIIIIIISNNEIILMEYKKMELKNKDEDTDFNLIFSKENVNMGHQPEIDYHKALLIILMIHDHVYYHYSLGSFYFYKIMEFFIFVFGAGGFMFLMGIGMKYTRHHEPKHFIERGIVLLTLSQLFNLIRDSIPNLIAWWVSGNKIFISRALLVLQVDILSFSGLAFLFLALMKKMKLSDNFIFIIGITMNMGAFFANKIMKSPNCFLLSQFLGYFILTDAESYFPLFSYFIFVACGYWLGGIYQKIANKEKFYNLILIFCLPILTIYYIFRKYYNFPMFPEYFSDKHYSLYPCPDAIGCCMTNLTSIAIFYKIHMILKGKTPEFIIHVGKNLNEYYIISYVLTLHLKNILISIKGEEYPSQMEYPVIFSIVIFISCRILIDINNKYIHFTITNLKYPMRNLIFTLIWITTFICVIYIYPKIEFYSTIWNNYLKNNANINSKSGV